MPSVQSVKNVRKHVGRKPVTRCRFRMSTLNGTGVGVERYFGSKACMKLLDMLALDEQLLPLGRVP